LTSVWEEIRHQVAVVGRVLDEQTGETVSHAIVRITEGPAKFILELNIKKKQYGERWSTMVERLDQTRTAADGFFHFLDLPDGQYTLTSFLPGSGSRYGTVQATVDVSRNAQGDITPGVANMGIPPTTLKGHITGPDSDGGTTDVVLADVRIKGSSERAFSNGEGQYALTGIESGNREVTVHAPGYQSVVRSVQIGEAGTVRTEDFVLVRSTS
jgi:hypothetical protein